LLQLLDKGGRNFVTLQTNMKSRKGFRSLSVQMTAVVSVTLVLLLLGTAATLGMFARNVTTDIKEQMGFDVVLEDTVTESEINSFKQLFSEAAYVSSFVYHSPEEILNNWRQEMGEDLTVLLDMNPFLPEFEINVKAEYASADSLDAIMIPLSEVSGVCEVNGHTEIVEAVSHNLSKAMMVLIIIMLALLPIALVLINNTVRLTIYSRRFTIHTMKLVGASRGFIRKPFLLSNMLQGLIAGILASALLAGAYGYLWNTDEVTRSALTSDMLLITCSGMLVCGPILCLIAAAWSTQRYLSKDYDKLF